MSSVVPDSLKADKTISAFVLRSLELENSNPVISYYCKIYVLEYILSNKLHTTGKDVEAYTVQLLDETEALKTNVDPENEGLHKVLNDKNLSLSVVMGFSYKLFNSCLEDLSKYDGSNKPQLVVKFRACLNFLTLLGIFYNKPDESIDYSKFSGGKANDAQSFGAINNDKIKLLKYRLSILLKDEVPIKGQSNTEKELEDELEQELNKIKQQDENEDLKTNDKSLNLPVPPKFIDTHDEDVDGNLDKEENSVEEESNEPSLPVAPSFIEDEETTQSTSQLNLPGAPRFLPEDEEVENTSDVKLPGAPLFLPDDDISHINKDSSITVIPPNENKPAPVHKPKKQPTLVKSNHANTTPQDINAIVDKAEAIAKIQKHAKFAISALNYEDLKTAEKELLEGLALLRKVPQ